MAELMYEMLFLIFQCTCSLSLFLSPASIHSKPLTYLQSGEEALVNGKWFAYRSDLLECIEESSFIKYFT